MLAVRPVLNERQKAFANYYIELGNATEAAKKAGYSPKTAYSIGNENLSKPEISEYIAERLKDKEAQRIASADEVMRFFSAVMRGEVKDQFGLETSVDTRINAGKEIMKRHAVATDRNRDTLERLDKMLEEFRNAVNAETE
jgi:phage terminase small subunit